MMLSRLNEPCSLGSAGPGFDWCWFRGVRFGLLFNNFVLCRAFCRPLAMAYPDGVESCFAASPYGEHAGRAT